MIDCISVENMRQSDAWTIANRVSGIELMGRAALGVYRAAEWKAPVAIVVGSGNNGGDGYALACILWAHDIPCTVYTVSTRCSADSAHYAVKAQAAGIPIWPFAPDCLVAAATIVDCLLGTGFHGEVRADYRTAIEAINQSGACVVSVDINSGMNGDTGEAGLAVCSDLTVTIGFVKKGLVTANAGRYMKKLVCADIGIVLQQTEEKICGPDEPLQPGWIPCPPWLDMNILVIE